MIIACRMIKKTKNQKPKSKKQNKKSNKCEKCEKEQGNQYRSGGRENRVIIGLIGQWYGLIDEVISHYALLFFLLRYKNINLFIHFFELYKKKIIMKGIH